jgi:hypothetical protein
VKTGRRCEARADRDAVVRVNRGNVVIRVNLRDQR